MSGFPPKQLHLIDHATPGAVGLCQWLQPSGGRWRLAMQVTLERVFRLVERSSSSGLLDRLDKGVGLGDSRFHLFNKRINIHFD